MKVIIAGGRRDKAPNSWTGETIYGRPPAEIYHELELAVIESGFNITSVISGEAPGVDRLGELYAKNHNKGIFRFPANWQLYGDSAGPKRNEQMGNFGDALVAIWDGKSKGTAHMIGFMKGLGKPVYVRYILND